MTRTMVWLFAGIILVGAPTAFIAMRLPQVPPPGPMSEVEDVAVPVSASEEEAPPVKQPQKLEIPPVSKLVDGEKPADRARGPRMAVPENPFEAGEFQASKEEAAPNALPGVDSNRSAAGATAKVVAARREGTQVTDLEGTISMKGSRFTFQPTDSSLPLTLLENQVLERIEHQEQSRSADSAPRRWKISGRVTEYRGSNGLLASSAIMVKSRDTK